MNTELLKKAEDTMSVSKRPNLEIGDTVVVHTIIRDGDKQRIQKFKGIVIAINGKNKSKTFTVRKISYGVGVEKIFPLYSTNIEKIEVEKHASTKKSKLYYLRSRIGKAAMKLKVGKAVLQEEDYEVNEVQTEEVKEKTDDKKEETTEEKDK